MCLQCRILGPLTHHLPHTHAILSQAGLVRLCRLFDFRPTKEQVQDHVRDVQAEEHLKDAVEMMKQQAGIELQVLRVDSDGSCLPHAVSRCLVGKEILFDALRAELFLELQQHEDFYKAQFLQGQNEETWALHWAQILDEARPTYGRRTGRWLGPGEHMLAMANLLSRPILVLDSLEEMKKGLIPNLYLPLRLSREEIAKNAKGGAFPGPICIGWSSPKHNHFISLVQLELDNSRDLTVKHTPSGLWTGIVERVCYPHAAKYGGREFDMPITVPLNHTAGSWVSLTDEFTKQEIRVPVPADKGPGQTFVAHLALPVPPLERAIITLLTENGKTARDRALKTIDLILTNLVEAGLAAKIDNIAKFSRLKRDNALVVSNIVAAPGGMELLMACGFQPEGEELIRKDIVGETLIHQRDMVKAITVAMVDWPSLPSGRSEVNAGMEQILFGMNPSYLESWAQAREGYASDGPDTSVKRASESRKTAGVWCFGTGARNTDSRKRIMDMLVTELRKSYEDVTHATPLADMTTVWDDDFLFNRRVDYVKCSDCGEDQEWHGAVDGPAAEAHVQECVKCHKKLSASSMTARLMLEYVANATDEEKWDEVGMTVRCTGCGTLNCPAGIPHGSGQCWKCGRDIGR